MSKEKPAEDVLGRYWTTWTTRNSVRISEINPGSHDLVTLGAAVFGLAQTMHEGLTARLVPTILTETDVDREVGGRIVRFMRPGRERSSARHLFAIADTPDDVVPRLHSGHVLAVAQIEPRLVRGRRLHTPVPRISYLETRSGFKAGPDSVAVLALLSHVIAPLPKDQPISADIESHDLDGLEFYRSYGFTEDARRAERVGDRTLEFITLTAPNAADVQQRTEAVLEGFRIAPQPE